MMLPTEIGKVLELEKLAKTGLTQKQMGEILGIGRSTVGDLLNRYGIGHQTKAGRKVASGDERVLGVLRQLREARVEMKMTQERLSKASGYAVTQIVRYEKGRIRRPSAVMIAELAEVLGLELCLCPRQDA